MRKDNGVPFAGLTLQISADRHCCHDIKRNVKVLRHADGTLLLLTGNDPHQSRAIASRKGQTGITIRGIGDLAEFVCTSTHPLPALPRPIMGVH